MNSTLNPEIAGLERAVRRAAERGPSPDAILLFQELILSYYRQNGRDLPWRRTEDPYQILVSEIMLQQTRVERVIPKFTGFISAFPTPGKLAAAPLTEVLAAWSGLGYNRRAINLQKTAIILRDEYDECVPCSPEILATFPGIGEATAAAICSYAFNIPIAYIETNIRSIFIHYFFQQQLDIPDCEILPIIEEALYRKNPREWYNALMDYGTHLKQRLTNPNQKSRHYTRQSRFAGSDREIRGEILRLLLSRREIRREALHREIDADERRIGKVLHDLWREGFLKEDSGTYSIDESGAQNPG